MKFVIAIAAVLSSAVLTVPTLTDVTESHVADVQQQGKLAANFEDPNNA